MSASTVRDAFRAKLQASLPTGWSYVETINSTEAPDAGAKYATLEFLGGVERPVSIGSPGSNRHRERAVVLVQLYAPRGAGHSDLESACDVIRSAFRQYRAGHLKVDGVDPPFTMDDDDHGMFRGTIPIEYRFDSFG